MQHRFRAACFAAHAPHRLSRLGLALVAAAAGWPCAAQSGLTTSPAQQVEVTGNALRKLDERLATTSRLGLTLRETPASVHLVNRARPR